MARKHKRRSYSGIQKLSLNGIGSALKSNVAVPQVAIGLAVGVAGIFALKKWIASQTAAQKPVNASLVNYATPIGAIAAAVAAYFVGSKVLKSNAKGTAMAIGAALGGAFLFGYAKLSNMPEYAFLKLGDTVGLRLNGMGFLVDSAGPRPYGGFIVDSPRPMLAGHNSNLGRLAAMHENEPDFEGMTN